MAEDVIVIEIDDSALDEALLKLQLLGVAAEQTTGRKRLDISLPGINREARVILGRVPGMRNALMYYFRLRRMERGIALIPTAGRLQFYLTIIATAIIVAQQIMRYFESIKREREQYQSYLMRERGWTRTELKNNYSQIHNYTRSFPG